MKIEYKNVKCAMCQKESEQTIVMTNMILGKPNLDMQPVGSKTSLGAGIQECPFCHYCNYSIDEFLQERFAKTLNPLELWNEDEAIQNIIENEPEEDTRKLRIMAEQFFQLPNYEMAIEFLIKSFWSSSLKEHKNQYLTESLNLYEYAILNDDIKKYIQLSDLNRQYGDLKNAKNFLETAKSLYKTLPEDTAIEDYNFYEQCFELEEYLIAQRDLKPHNLSEF